jgi:hypothetical protein
MNDEHIGYVIIGIQNTRVKKFLRLYGDLKDEYGIGRENPIHCRTLWHGSQRKKNKHFKHLTQRDIKNLVKSIINLYRTYNKYEKYMNPIVSITAKDGFVGTYKKKYGDGENFKFDYKKATRMMEKTCQEELDIRMREWKSRYKFHRDKISAKDRESKNGPKTKDSIKPINMAPGFLTFENRKILDHGIKYEDAPHKEMYEIADLFAYTLVRAETNEDKQKENIKFFLEIKDRVLPINCSSGFEESTSNFNIAWRNRK